MFDDQSPKNPGQPPKNLPLSEPEDIFAPTDSVPPTPPSAMDAGYIKPKQTEELSETSIPLETSQARPVEPRPLNPESISSMTMSIPEKSPLTDSLLREPRLGKIIFRVLLLVLLLAVLLALVWWVFAFFTDSSEEENNQKEPIETDLSGNSGSQNQADTGSRVEDVDDTILFGQPVDTDADGLEDNREQDIGTDPGNWDSDNDQLSDGDEVIIWKTDPRNPDTDGDGHLDGQEIKSGYSPTGPGRIFAPPGDV